MSQNLQKLFVLFKTCYQGLTMYLPFQINGHRRKIVTAAPAEKLRSCNTD